MTNLYNRILFDLETLDLDYSHIENRIMNSTTLKQLDVKDLLVKENLMASSFYKEISEASQVPVTTSTADYEDRTKKELIELLEFRDECIEDLESEIKEVEETNKKLSEKVSNLQDQLENKIEDPSKSIANLADYIGVSRRDLERILSNLREDQRRKNYDYTYYSKVMNPSPLSPSLTLKGSF